MATANLTIPEDLLQGLQQTAQDEQITPDEVAVQAIKHHLAKKAIERFRREGEKARGNMTDEQVEEYVNKVIHEYRAENRGH